MAAKLVLWEGNNITAIERTALVKIILSSQAVCYMTVLISSEHSPQHQQASASLSLVCLDKTTGVKCKVNWGMMCWPYEHVGFWCAQHREFRESFEIENAMV